MNIAIVSVFNVSLLEDFVYPEYKNSVRRLDSNFTPAVSNLVLEFLRKGENIIIFTQDIKAKKIEEFHGEKVSIYVAPKIPKYKNIFTLGLYTIFAIKKLFKLHKGTIDIVSAHWTRDYAIAAGTLMDKVPVFVTIRDIMPKIISKVTSDRLRWRMIWLKNEYVLHKKGYRFIANSAYTANEVKRLWGYDVPIIPNSIPIFDDKNKCLNQSRRLTPEIKITSISLSDFPNKWKNVLTLLNAFSIFRKNYPNAVLYLVGPFFIKENPLVESYSKEGLMKGVRLMGKRTPEEIIDILKESTMMVHPSLEETFGNTLIEALACGIPVIGGSQSGAVPWVLNHGDYGYLCDMTLPQEISDTMLYIAEHYDEAVNKGNVGRDECKKNYSSNNVADKYLELFRNATKY